LLYATIFHSLAGLLAGSVFRIGTLLLLLLIIVIETLFLTTLSPSSGLVWGCINLTVIQVTYLIGVHYRTGRQQPDTSLRQVTTRPPR
jgi:hypothetical protein